jgi:hypothetical protein
MRFNFCGPTYASRSITADGERCVNLYPEIVESAGAKSRMALYPTPGLRLWTTLPTGPIRGMWSGLAGPFGAGPDQLFAVGGSKLYQISETGVPTLLGDILGGDDTEIVQMFANGTQLWIVNNGNGRIWDNVALSNCKTGPNPLDLLFPTTGCFMDGYFIATQVTDTKAVWVSSLWDGKNWDPLDFGVKEAGRDSIVSVFADHGELWVFGTETTEVWGNTGDADFPFKRIPGALIEQGCAGANTIVKLDNSLFWLGQDRRGQAVVWRANGYAPTRISNHALETALQATDANGVNRYAARNAIAYGYQEAGHTFYVLNFPSLALGGSQPTQGATWVYDVSTGMWHERGVWNGASYDAQWCWHHVYVFGNHLVGDHRNGKIYAQSLAFPDDAGTPKRWMRTTPHIGNELQRVRYNHLYIDAEPGVNATVSMQFSDNGGKTWSHTYTDSLSAADPRARLKWNRLGAGRDRVFSVFGTTPVSLIDAYVGVSGGSGS